MKYLILCGDGMADFPLEALGGQTPLAYAATPAMDRMAAEGFCGDFTPIPDGMPAGSDIGNLSLFGYDPRQSFTGRAPIEAANQGIPLADNQVCFRCNFVTLRDGVMASFTAGHITTDESRRLIDHLNASFSMAGIRFFPGVQYRNLAVVDAESPEELDALKAMATTPPHNIPDQLVDAHLPAGKACERIRAYMTHSEGLLEGHETNAARLAAGKPPATSIWLWGQGVAPTMESYAQRFNRTGSVISAVDVVKGIGVCAGLTIAHVPGATGYIDTDYEGKIQAALTALETQDMAYVHVEAPDETAHEGRTDLKVRAIEDFDARIVAPAMAFARERGDVRVLVAPDHVTAISTKAHAGGPVPFVVAGAGVEASGRSGYHEEAGRTSGVLIDPGFELIRSFLSGAPLSAAAYAGAART